jgi:hypothetical protein
VTFKISKGYPPDEEWPIAEILENVEGGVNAPAVVRIEGAERRLVIYDRSGQVAWDYPFDAFLGALHQAESSLSEYSS